MADVDDENELPTPGIFHRWRRRIWNSLIYALPVISIGAASLAGYFTYVAAHTRPNADLSNLAVSILKTGDASPEMRRWATDVLGIPTDLPM